MGRAGTGKRHFQGTKYRTGMFTVHLLQGIGKIVVGKFIVGTFAILGWAFYVASGGANFVPETRMAEAETEAETPVVAMDTARISTSSVLSAAPAQQPVEPVVAAEVQPVVTSPAIQPAQPATAEAVATTVAYDPAKAPAYAGETSASGDAAQPVFASLSAPAPEAIAAPASADLSAIREVAGRAVNMREGPSTSYNVIDTLLQGTRNEVVDSDGAGWVRVRVVETGQMGWMAERLLTNG